MRLALAAFLVAASASAQVAPPPPPAATPAAAPAAGPCADDARRLCADLRPGEDVPACLMRRRAELSPACAAARPGLAAPPAPKPEGPGTRTKTGGGAGDCKTDAERLCDEQENRSGMRAACLRRHYSELSPGCQDAHPEWRPSPETVSLVKSSWKQLVPHWKVACPPPTAASCQAQLGSEAAWWACVERNWRDLPEACRDFARTHNSWRRKCPGTFEELCGGADPERSGACMLRHAKTLKGGCRKFADESKPAKKKR